jgi:hypothetical protein
VAGGWRRGGFRRPGRPRHTGRQDPEEPTGVTEVEDADRDTGGGAAATDPDTPASLDQVLRSAEDARRVGREPED